MDAGEALKSILPAAVPLWIHEFKGLPWSEVQAIATESSQFIAEHGDNILFRGPKKGDTANAFNHLARGIAVLAFAPGGVTTMGMHFEAIHPESFKGGAARWLYHSTFADAIPGIAKHGLVPDEKPRWGGQYADSSKGKIFFAGSQAMAAGYADTLFAENLASHGWSWDPILLRVHSAHVGDVERDRHSLDDWFMTRKIPWTFVQVWVPQKEAWTEVREAENQGYFQEFQTKYGDPGKLDVAVHATPGEYATRYIQQFWPKE